MATKISLELKELSDADLKNDLADVILSFEQKLYFLLHLTIPVSLIA